jgi:hypothetical protein
MEEMNVGPKPGQTRDRGQQKRRRGEKDPVAGGQDGVSLLPLAPLTTRLESAESESPPVLPLQTRSGKEI